MNRILADQVEVVFLDAVVGFHYLVWVSVSPVLARTGLDTYFESLVLSSEVGSEKPDPAIFREALRQMPVSPERAIFVGDFYSIDVVGARGVAITPILLDAKGLSSDRDVTRI